MAFIETICWHGIVTKLKRVLCNRAVIIGADTQL